jgi:hypothetical protein
MRSYIQSCLSLTVCLSFLLGFILAGATSPAQGQAYNPQNGGPPPGSHQHYTTNKWDVVPLDKDSPVKGICILDCYTDELDEVHLELRGVRPNGVYSVWLTRRESPEVIARASVGIAWEGKAAADATFVGRPNGTANFHGCLHNCPLGTWKTLEIRYHPDKNGKNVETSVLIVKIPLKGN